MKHILRHLKNMFCCYTVLCSAPFRRYSGRLQFLWTRCSQL